MYVIYLYDSLENWQYGHPVGKESVDRDFKEVIKHYERLVKNKRYCAASIRYAKDVNDRGRKVAEVVEAGYVGVETWVQVEAVENVYVVYKALLALACCFMKSGRKDWLHSVELRDNGIEGCAGFFSMGEFDYGETDFNISVRNGVKGSYEFYLNDKKCGKKIQKCITDLYDALSRIDYPVEAASYYNSGGITQFGIKREETKEVDHIESWDQYDIVGDCTEGTLYKMVLKQMKGIG
jgi:hypothetical protein